MKGRVVGSGTRARPMPILPYRFTGLLLGLALTVGVVLAAPGQPADQLIEAGRSAIEAGNLQDAARILERAVETDDGPAEAHHLLARLHMEPELFDLEKVKSCNGRALKLDPDNVDYLTLRLYRLHHYPANFLPGLQTANREDLARRILELDEDNATAHHVIGEIALEDYLNARKSVSFPDLDNLDVRSTRESLFNAAYLLDPALAEDLPEEMTFELARTGISGRLEYVVKDGEAAKRYDHAKDHLWKAVQSDPANLDAFRLLMTLVILEWDAAEADRLSEVMVRSRPESSETWLFRGVASYRANRLAEAGEAFERAVSLMQSEDAAVFEDASHIIGQLRLNSADRDRWKGKDPVLLTPQNERRLEHFARLAYADLRFGRKPDDVRGWYTEPGEVIVRYGIPLAEAQNSTRFDKYLVLHYGGFYFKFMDLVKSGKLTFYSPKAGNASPDFNVIERAFDNDFTLISNQIFREVPERFVYDGHGRRTPFPYLASSFLSEGGPEVVVALGIPEGPGTIDVRSGVFVLDDRGEVVAAKSGDEVRSSFTARGDDKAYHVFHGTVEVPDVRRPTLAVEFEERERDLLGFQRMSLSVPKRKGDGPILSDILLAHLVEESVEESIGESIEESVEDSGGALLRRGHAILPAPWGVYPAGSPVYFYFETYGLRDEGSGQARVEIEARLRHFDEDDDLRESVQKLFSGRERDGVSVRYTGAVRADSDARYMILDTDGVAAGTYVLGLRLTETSTGKTATAGRVIVLERPAARQDQDEE